MVMSWFRSALLLQGSNSAQWYTSPEWWLVIVAFLTLVFLGRQAWETRRSAEGTKASLESLINSERAWVMVDFEWIPNLGIANGSNSEIGHNYSVEHFLICTNCGKTPGWITEIRFKIGVLPLPPIPQLDDVDPQHTVPEPLAPDGKPFRKDYFTTTPGSRPNKFVLYGVVKYRDVFGPERRTYFAFEIIDAKTPPERLAGYPEYNKNT